MAKKSPRRLQTREWDPLDAKYSDLEYPEWVMGRVPHRFWNDPHNHRRYFRWLKKQLKIETPDDWYQVKNEDLARLHGKHFLSYYGHSLVAVLRKFHPRKRWHEWLFHSTGPYFWDEPANRLRYMSWLANELGFRTATDWYQLNAQTLKDKHGHGLFNRYHCSVRALIADCFPDHDWKPWLFSTVPAGFWNQRENRLQYMAWLGHRLRFRKPEDWYQVTTGQFSEHHGGSLISCYGNSRLALLQEYYPEFHWHPWKFKVAPNGFWKNRKNRVQYLKWLEGELGYSGPEDWYQITRDRISGSTLLNSGGKLVDCMRELYPKFRWQPERFSSNGYFDKPENQRKFVYGLAKKLGVQKLDDWYRVRREDFVDHGGEALLTRHGSSFVQVLKSVVPDHDWHEWQFPSVSDGFWESRDNRIRFVNWMGKRFGVEKPEDWYRVTRADFVENGCGGLLDNFEGVQALLQDCFPHFDWQPWSFKKVPDGHWQDASNRKRYLHWLGAKLGYRKPDDWYQLKRADLSRNFGGSVVALSRKTIPQLVQELFPGATILGWKFCQVPARFWDHKSNRLAYLRWLGRQLGFENAADWHDLKQLHFEKNNGSTLYQEYYKGSLSTAMQELFPRRQWYPWVFHKLPVGFWYDPLNRKAYMTWLAGRIGIREPADWYRVLPEDFHVHHGGGLLHNEKSVARIVMATFPEHHWYAWKFDRVPNGFWKDSKNVDRYVIWLAKSFEIRAVNDWDRFNSRHLEKMHWGTLLRNNYQGAAIKFQKDIRARWSRLKTQPDTSQAGQEVQ